MDLSETAEHRLLRESTARLARRFGHEYFLTCARAGVPAQEMWIALADAGLLGVAIPEEFGGGGLGVTEMALVAEELASHGCPNLLLAVLMVCAPVISRFGTR